MGDYINVAGECLLLAETIIRHLPDFSSSSSSAACSNASTRASSSSSSSSSATNGTTPSTSTGEKYNSSVARRSKPVLSTTKDILSFISSLGKGDLEKMTAQQQTDLAQLDGLKDMEMHQSFMRAAIGMANHALKNDETPVGCVFVHKGEVIGRGMNHTNKTLNGTRHAEFVALAEILQVYSPEVLKETDLYVTVEPCIMCASALRQYGIRAVYFGCFNDRFGGTGGVLRIHDDEMSDPKFVAVPGIFREDAIMLLRKFYIQENEKAPEPKQKKTRELKTEIVPLDLTKHRPSATPLMTASPMASPVLSYLATRNSSPSATPAITTPPPPLEPKAKVLGRGPNSRPTPRGPASRIRPALPRTVMVGQVKERA